MQEKLENIRKNIEPALKQKEIIITENPILLEKMNIQ